MTETIEAETSYPCYKVSDMDSDRDFYCGSYEDAVKEYQRLLAGGADPRLYGLADPTDDLDDDDGEEPICDLLRFPDQAEKQR